MIGDALLLLGKETLVLTGALALVLALRGTWRRAFGAGRAMPLWLLVPAAMFAVALPARVVVVASESTLAPLSVAPMATIAQVSPSMIEPALLALWLTGVMFAALAFFRAQRGFLRELGELRRLRGKLYLASGAGTSPVALGLLRSRIVLPADFRSRYSRVERALILRHEHSHLRRGDIFIGAIATALRIVFWFNPLVHLAATRLRQDQELAADADVLRAHPTARRRYATALLNAQLAVPGLPVGCLWQSSHPIKERIMSIARPQPSSRRQRLGMAISFTLAFGCGLAAWAAQPARAAQEPVDQPAMEDIQYRRSEAPKYPLSAIEQGQSGMVVLRVTVSSTGEPEQVEIESAEPPSVFDTAAIDAVKNWKFQPKIENGVAVQGKVLVPICFSLEENSQQVCNAK